MAHVFKGQSDDSLMLILVVIGLLIILGIAVVILVTIGKPAALKAIPLIGDAMCEIKKLLGSGC